MKTMCPPGYHQNGFVATYALRPMMYGFTLLVPMNQRVLNKLSKEHAPYKRFMSSFIYSWKKKTRDFTKLYAFQPFYENNERLLAFNYFSQKAPSEMFRWVLNTSLNKKKFFYIRIFGS